MTNKEIKEKRKKYNIPNNLCMRQEIVVQTGEFNRYLRLGIIIPAVPPARSNCTYPWKLFRRVSILRIDRYKDIRGIGFSYREQAFLSNHNLASPEALWHIAKMKAILASLPDDGVPAATEQDIKAWKQRRLAKREKSEKERSKQRVFLSKFTQNKYTKRNLFSLLNKPCPKNYIIPRSVLIQALEYGWNLDSFHQIPEHELLYEEFRAKERELRAQTTAKEQGVNKAFYDIVLDMKGTPELVAQKNLAIAGLHKDLRERIADAYYAMLDKLYGVSDETTEEVET